MRVRCVTDDVDAVPHRTVRDRLRRSITVQGRLSDLTVGELYTVLVIQERDGGVWILLDTLPQSAFPYPYPIEMFEVADASMPMDWFVRMEKRESGTIIKEVGPREWVQNEHFYEQLIDGDPAASESFLSQRALSR